MSPLFSQSVTPRPSACILLLSLPKTGVVYCLLDGFDHSQNRRTSPHITATRYAGSIPCTSKVCTPRVHWRIQSLGLGFRAPQPQRRPCGYPLQVRCIYDGRDDDHHRSSLICALPALEAPHAGTSDPVCDPRDGLAIASQPPKFVCVRELLHIPASLNGRQRDEVPMRSLNRNAAVRLSDPNLLLLPCS